MNCDGLHYYRYVILYDGGTEDVEPVFHVTNFDEIKQNNENRMHLFDEELVPVLPAIEYCLHLPRTEMDTYNIETETMDKAHDVPHEIIVMPGKALLMYRLPFRPTLVICSDNCGEEIKHKVDTYNSMLGCVSVKDLSYELLQKQWNLLYEKRCMKNAEKLKDIDKQFLLTDDKQLLLPALYTARQYGKADVVYSKIFNSTDIFKTCANYIWNQRVHHNGLMHCEGFEGEDGEKFRKMFAEGIEMAQTSTRINVVITMPGVPKRQVNYGGLSNRLPEEERRVIRLLGLHRAIAKEALLVELAPADEKLFEKLDELEINCKKGTNNKYVKKTLRDIGKMIEKKLTQEQLWAINWANHITVFSDFPIGLAILGEGDSSLQCYKDISYRPLSPLTRCFQFETVKHQQYYYGEKCKIAFAECVPNDEQNKLVRFYSDRTMYSLKRLCNENSKMEVSYRETLTIKDLKKFIADNIDADILYISAHGCYERRINMAGLMIGNEFWMADESDYRVPPVVILSACHVSPRGSGCVNVADLFMRAGADAVLGTFIPVNARRNMLLINRLYIYIAEAQKGSAQYKTLSEAWSGVVATNAILEMMETSPGFKRWIMGKNIEGKYRFTEFTLKRSVGRLNGRTMYADTITVIKEMLHEEGLDGKFDDVLSQDDYFPESFFYQWIGFPENVLLYNEIFAKWIEREKNKV